MLIRNDIKYMDVETEIHHIVKSLNIVIKKLKCEHFLLYNNGTKEDIAFIEIFKNNREEINADLFCLGKQMEDLEEMFNITEGEYNNLLQLLLTTHKIAIINTDTFFIEKANQEKNNYNIEVFKDYSSEFIEEIIKFYNMENYNFSETQMNLNEEEKEILKDYIFNNDLPKKYTKKQLEDFSDKLPAPLTTKLMIYNSITTNYIKGINKDLEEHMN